MNRFRRVSTGWQRKKKGNEIHFKPTPSTLAVGGVVSDNEVFVQLSLSLSHRQPQASESPSSVPFSSHATLEAHSFPSVLPCEYVLFLQSRTRFLLAFWFGFQWQKKKGCRLITLSFGCRLFFSLSLSLSSISSLRFPSSPFFNFLLGELESGHLIRPLFVDAILAWLESQGRRFDARTCRSIRRFGSCTSARF